LAALSLVSPVWLGFAALGALTLIRLKRQHPVKRHTEELDGTPIALACTMLAIFALTFVPIPARLGPLQRKMAVSPELVMTSNAAWSRRRVW